MVDGVPFTNIKLIIEETACFLLNVSLKTWPWRLNTSRTVLCRDVIQMLAFQSCTHRVCGICLDTVLFILMYLHVTGI